MVLVVVVVVVGIVVVAVCLHELDCVCLNGRVGQGKPSQRISYGQSHGDQLNGSNQRFVL